MGFPVPGGSVLVSCRIDDIVRGPDGQPSLDGNGNIQITPHGYVREYHQYRDLIRDHLKQMFNSGQRRLGLALAFHAGGDSFALDCTSGTVIPQDGANLYGILTDSISFGFEEFVLEIIPEWEMSYDNWLKPEVMGAGETRPFQPLKYGLLLSFIYDIWMTAKQAVAGKANLYIDLLGECSNTDVGSRLWVDWCTLFPDLADPATMIGFSQVPAQAFIDMIPKLYPNDRLPRVWNIHPYNNTGVDGAEMTWQHYKTKLSAAYPNDGFIVGEISTNDPASAKALAPDLTGLFWILQWPVLNGVTPPFMTQDRLTLAFDAYRDLGTGT